MSMSRLMSAAHAAGYAMAAEDISEPRAEVLVPKSSALVVHHAPQRGVIANAHRSLRKMWLRAWAADHWSNRAAA